MLAEISDQLRGQVLHINDRLDDVLPAASTTPARLHEAMRYAVLNGGKRVRPLLVYATGTCLGIDVSRLDPIAVAIELIHAFSLVHDDLPAMDDDDLRRGRPTVHKAFDEATAILAADALQPLAFQVVAESADLTGTEKASVISAIAKASGSLGMTGGQSIDLEAEGKSLTANELREMHQLKTGALLSASVLGVAELDNNADNAMRHGLTLFAGNIGLAFQIRDDILDVVGETDVIGKSVGADQRKQKVTWPALFGLGESRRQCNDLLEAALQALQPFAGRADELRWLARYIVERAL